MNGTFPPRKLPSPTTIHVWSVQLDNPVNAGVDLDNILSAEERSRAERYIFLRDAVRFRHCRSMLRLGLGWYLQKPPRDIELTANSHGKPCLAEDLRLYFNVTHSGGLGLIAFTTVGEVGIDVEAVRRDVEAVEISSANFTVNEAAIIAAAETPEKQASIFLRFWTRKEAVLKAAGHGILHGLNTVDVSQLPAAEVKLNGTPKKTAASCWRVQDLRAMDGFVAAVAGPAGDWSILQWPMRLEDVIQVFAEEFPSFL